MLKPSVIPAHDDSNGWWEILTPATPPLVLKGKQRVRTAVIGGGICGISVAQRLAELCPDDSICVVDAERIGNGASGRNAGFMLDMHAHGEPKKLDILRRNLKLWEAGLDSFRQKVQQWQIQCDWTESGRYYGAAGSIGLKRLKNIARTLDILGREHSTLSEDAMHERFATSFYQQGVHAEGSALVNPAALMRGLAAHLPTNVDCYESSPITGFEQQGSGYRLLSANGEIIADRVVLAAGVFLKEFGVADVNYVPMATYGSLSAPLDDGQFDVFNKLASFGILGASENGSTIRLTEDRRLMVRNHFHFEAGHPASNSKVADISSLHTKAMLARWPALKGLTFEHSWGGIMAFTRNNGSVFGEMRKNLYAILTNDVSPMTRGEAAGKLLAEYMEGQDSELLSVQLSIPEASKVPARPMLDVGVAMKLGYLRFVAGGEV